MDPMTGSETKMSLDEPRLLSARFDSATLRPRPEQPSVGQQVEVEIKEEIKVV